MKGSVTIGLLLAASLALSACGKSGEMTPSPGAPDNAASTPAPAPAPAMPPPAATAPMPASTSAAPPSASTAGDGANPQH